MASDNTSSPRCVNSSRVDSAAESDFEIILESCAALARHAPAPRLQLLPPPLLARLYFPIFRVGRGKAAGSIPAGQAFASLVITLARPACHSALPTAAHT